MRREFSNRLRNDAHCMVLETMRRKGIVNIAGLAEEIRLKNAAENIAREDIEALVMHIAQLYGGIIEFDEQVLTALDLPDACVVDNRNDLERALSERSYPRLGMDLLQLDRE